MNVLSLVSIAAVDGFHDFAIDGKQLATWAARWTSRMPVGSPTALW